ncbi:Heat-inducible transcription repressor [Hirschfeldia incana]|nr:Heat-inducible transcription repressor [Hirschfeldia incana]
MSSKTRDVLEGLVKDTSLNWLLGKQTSLDDEIEEIENSPSAGSNWIPELSPVANVVIRRCSKVLGVSVNELQDSFKQEASGSVKQPSMFPRNFLEYCCFRALALSVGVTGHLTDKTFRRLTFDMMVAWELPSASSTHSLLSVDGDPTVGLEAFSRIAPAVPVIADVIISENLFGVLASSSDGVRLRFSVYDKYLCGLERAIKKMKSQSESSLLSGFRPKGEKILEIDGTVTTQPVLEHIGMSTWPGRLILTDHALYFEAIKVVSFDTPKRYSLSEDLKQVVKPELTGPWGTRLFDKAVSYKSISLPEPVVMEFPELKGHTRRDYWLAIIREVLYVHRYMNKFKIVTTGVAKDEAISKAVLGVLRVQAIQELGLTNPVRYENLLPFNLCDQLPGGDHVLETLADMSSSRVLDRTNKPKEASDMVSQFGLVFGSSPRSSSSLVVGEVVVGDMNPLEKAVKQSRKNYEKVVLAQETVNGVKADGIDTNLAVMKELLLPVMEIGNWLLALAYWDNPLKSFVFCLFATFIIYRGWIGYVFAFASIFIAGFIVLTRCFSKREKVMMELKVMAPPPMNTMEQLLAVQNAISQLEELVQDANIVLLKLRALLLSLFPQASEKFAVAIVVATTMMVLLPWNSLIMVVFLELFTRYSPPRRASTERMMRRLKEWWFSIPAAPVILEQQNKDDNKKTK